MDHDAGAGRPGVDESESGRHASRSEETLAAAQHNRKELQAVLVHQVVPDECLGQSPTAVHLEFPAGLALEPGDLFNHIALDQR